MKHEDSFIYLAAINGVCSLAVTYPEIAIETLVREYIDMPERITSGDISVENRIKLGEILVKTTRGLGNKSSRLRGSFSTSQDESNRVLRSI